MDPISSIKNLELQSCEKIGVLENRLEGFTDFLTVVAAFNDALKKPQHIG